MACSRCVLPRPVPPWMNSGLKLTVSAVASVLAAVAGDLVGLADDEGLEPVARVEIGRVGIARRRSPAGAGISSRISSGDGRGASAAATIRTSRTIGSAVRHASVSRSPKWMRTQSAMNWLGMTSSSSPESGVEGAKLGGLQPAVERAGAAIAAKACADILPGRGRAAFRGPPTWPDRSTQLAQPPALRGASSWLVRQAQRGLRAEPESRRLSLSLRGVPPVESLPERVVLRAIGDAFKRHFSQK